MNYWIVKANPRLNRNFSEIFVPETNGTWYARRIPKTFTNGDKVIFWQSGTGFRVIALGEVENRNCGNDDDGKYLFSLTYHTRILQDCPDIQVLRRMSLFDNAGFLKAGPADTIFRLSLEQGEYLYNISLPKTNIAKKDHLANELYSTINDLSVAPNGCNSPDRALTSSSRYKRDNNVRLYVMKRANGVCEYCGVNGFQTPDGCYYLETHHIIALSANGPDTVNNVVALCANHHREVHYGNNAYNIEAKLIDKHR